MKNLLIAAAALTIGFGAATLPASASLEDYGQFRYTQDEQSRFSPASSPSEDVGARDVQRQRLYDNEDAKHKAY